MKRGVVFLLVTALLLTACASEAVEVVAPPSPSPQAPPPELEVELTQNRRDLGTRTIQVKVGNSADGAVAIEQVGVEVDGFEPTEPRPEDALLPPGIRVDLPVTLGESRCDGTDESAGEPVVILRVRPEGAEAQDVEMPLEASWALDGLFARECAREAVAEAVDLSFGPTWTLEGTALRGTVAVERLDSTEPIAVTGVRGIVLYNTRLLDGPFTLEAGADRADVPIELTTARCDGHALGESKQSFVMELWVELGDDPERYTTLEADEPARERWLELSRVGCGLG